MKLSGIYKITNLSNGKFYIGSAKNIQKRWSGHLTAMRSAKHPNLHLQNSYNKYGESNFKFEILLECPITSLRVEEQKLLDIHYGKDYCYNAMGKAAGNYTIIHSPESNAKRSLALKGKPLSNAHKIKIGASNKGKTRSDADKKKMSIRMTGFVMPDATKAKIGKQLRGENATLVKLTESQVLEIRALYNPKTMSSRKLAALYGVKDKKTIMNIIHRKTWIHI